MIRCRSSPLIDVPRHQKQELESVAAGELVVSGSIVGGDDGAWTEMLHPDLLEFHVKPAFEYVGQREPFVMPCHSSMYAPSGSMRIT